VLVNPEFVNDRSQLGVLSALQTAFAAVLEVGKVGYGPTDREWSSVDSHGEVERPLQKPTFLSG
jgi:hypothetical protein